MSRRIIPELRRRPPKVQLTCAKCRATFERCASKTAAAKAHYCSAACRLDAIRAPVREKPVKHIAAVYRAGEALRTTMCGAERDAANVIVLAAGLADCAACKAIRAARVTPPGFLGRAA